MLVGKDSMVLSPSPGMTGSGLANGDIGRRERGEGESPWDSAGGSNSSKQSPSKGSRGVGGLGILMVGGDEKRSTSENGKPEYGQLEGF